MHAIRVAKWARPNELTCQPMLKVTGWIEDFNPTASSNPSRLTRQFDGPKSGLGRLGLLVCF